MQDGILEKNEVPATGNVGVVHIKALENSSPYSGEPIIKTLGTRRQGTDKTACRAKCGLVCTSTGRFKRFSSTLGVFYTGPDYRIPYIVKPSRARRTIKVHWSTRTTEILRREPNRVGHAVRANV